MGSADGSGELSEAVGGASVTYRSCVPVWIAPKFHQRCCELATSLQSKVGSISLRFYGQATKGTAGEPCVQPKAEMAWRNEPFVTIECPPEQLSRELGDVLISDVLYPAESPDAFVAIRHQLRIHAWEIVKRHRERVLEAEKIEKLLDPTHIPQA